LPKIECPCVLEPYSAIMFFFFS